MIDDYAYQSAAGQCATVAALVIALQENGVLPLGRYSDALHRLWLEMPEDEAVGESGAVVERVLDLLAAHASTAYPSKGGKGDIPVLTRRPVTNDAIGRPTLTPLKALLHFLSGARPQA